jgi:signal transduction histidine kinase/CheY-like chemotaxis protein
MPPPEPPLPAEPAPAATAAGGAAAQPAGARPATVKRRLVQIVTIMLLPIVSIALAAAFIVYREKLDTAATSALETARALSLVTDRELAVRATVLRTLAASASLQRGDLEAFHGEARAVMPSFDNTIVLSGVDGQQLLNTRVPYGSAPLPKSRGIDWDNPPPPDQMIVSDLYMAPIGRRHSFAVMLPVYQANVLRGYLSMGSFASQLQRIFEQQPLPAGWVGTVIDKDGYIVARNTRAAELVGKRATDDMLAAIAKASHGMHVTRTLDGTPVFTVFNRAPESRWTVLIGLPRSEVAAPAWRALAGMAVATALFTALALAFALRAARRIADPVRQLHDDALALGAGRPIADRPTGLAETDAVQRLLARASVERSEADKRLNARVLEAVADTERAQRAALSIQKLEALGRLTGGIAHDFNNLLQSMTTGLQVAQRLTSDERAANALAICQRAVAKAVKLTRQLMTFGRSQPGHLAVVDVQAQLLGMQDLVTGAARETVQVGLDIAPGLWRVQVDPVQLELAVLNVVLNARDAMPEGGEVDISARNATLSPGEMAELGAGDYVVIAVRDSGVGIAPDVLQRVFEPFFTTKPVGKGSGMGLAQVYGFSRASGGTATIRSQPGAGTVVEMWLPRTHVALSSEATTPALPREARHSGTLLLVEDDAMVRGLTSQALEERGFRVVVAANAEDALAIARTRADIDAVLSDVVMPGGQTGMDLARTLAVLRPALPVILASGYADAVGSDSGLRVIAKPYDVDEVAQLLAEAIGQRARSATV